MKIHKLSPHTDGEELIKADADLSKDDDVAAILASDSGGVKIVVAAGASAQKMGVNAGAIVREMSKLVGGGTDVTKIEEALEKGDGE